MTAPHKTAIESIFTSRFVGITFYAILLNEVRNAYTVSVDVSTNIFTTSAPHNYILNTPIKFAVASGGVLPAPLDPTITYYARDITSTTFKVSATYGGVAIDITSAGIGTLTVTDLALTNRIPNVSEYVRHETLYDGISSRPSFTPPSITSSDTQVTANGTNSIINNAAGTIGLTFNGVLWVRGGSASIGDTTGTPEGFVAIGSSLLIPAGQSDVLQFPIYHLL